MTLTPAYQIVVQPKEEISFRKQSSSDLLIFQNPISAIGPGEEISFFYNSAIELFSKENPVLTFHVKRGAFPFSGIVVHHFG